MPKGADASLASVRFSRNLHEIASPISRSASAWPFRHVRSAWASITACGAAPACIFRTIDALVYSFMSTCACPLTLTNARTGCSPRSGYSSRTVRIVRANAGPRHPRSTQRSSWGCRRCPCWTRDTARGARTIRNPLRGTPRAANRRGRGGRRENRLCVLCVLSGGGRSTISRRCDNAPRRGRSQRRYATDPSRTRRP